MNECFPNSLPRIPTLCSFPESQQKELASLFQATLQDHRLSSLLLEACVLWELPSLDLLLLKTPVPHTLSCSPGTLFPDPEDSQPHLTPR